MAEGNSQRKPHCPAQDHEKVVHEASAPSTHGQRSDTTQSSKSGILARYEQSDRRYRDICNAFKIRNQKETLVPHSIRKYPSAKVIADILDFEEESYLIMVDYYSD